MRLIQCVCIFGIVLLIGILNVECQLKFDAEGNIIDDGLNLNVPSFPKDQKKPRPMVEKSSRLMPKSDRVIDNGASKDTGSRDATLDELLKMAGLDSKGQKLESPKADKVAQREPAPNPLANLDPEQLKTLLAKAANPSLDSKAVAEEKKDNKVAEGLGQMLGGGSETRMKNENSSIKLDDSVVSKRDAVPENKPTEALPQGLRQLNNKEADPQESQFKEGEQVELYPWQSEICKDYDEEACSAFKPMCSIMAVIAHKKCRKTCKLCLQDKPKPRTVKAKLKEFSLTLTQNGPLAPSFLTVCIEQSASQQYGLPDDVLSLIIHSYGDANEDTCENFGPHFNPFGVDHGHPEDVTKHVGDLGILEFRKVPDEWPEDVIRCKPSQIGSYGVFDHINLYGENSPCYRPVVM